MNVNQPVVYAQTNRPGCLLQLLWFGLVGWWFGLIWIAVAWALMQTFIGMPFAGLMLNNVPQVIALRGRRVMAVAPNGSLQEIPQVGIVWRALWFFVIGWWASAIWLVAAYLCCVSIILLPISFWMFDATPTVVSLKRM
jgi:uncharacterized membrane protein YccF (DUF307 family)